MTIDDKARTSGTRLNDRPHRVYVAGCLERILEARALAGVLGTSGYGIEVVSTWHDHDPTAPDVSREREATLSVDEQEAVARTNLRDRVRATALVLLADRRSRGAVFEAGVATGAGKRVVALGDRSSVTPMLATATWVRTVPEAVAALHDSAARVAGDGT